VEGRTREEREGRGKNGGKRYKGEGKKEGDGGEGKEGKERRCAVEIFNYFRLCIYTFTVLQQCYNTILKFHRLFFLTILPLLLPAEAKAVLFFGIVALSIR